MFRDDYLSLGPITMIEDIETASLTITPPHHHDNNILDDVFGSAPASPTLQGSEPQSGRPGYFAGAEPSDIPRLRSEHSTAGYRDGLTVAKGYTIQAGFDEGYSLGAVVGLRVGAVLGILDGLCSAVGKMGVDAEKDRMQALLQRGSGELKTESVFGAEWWGEDGTWKFEVKGEDGEEVTFKEVVDAHPLIGRWEEIVRDEIERWGVDLRVLETGEVQRVGVEKLDKKAID